MELAERVDDSWLVLLRRERAWMDRLAADGCGLFNALSPCAVRWDHREPPERWRSFWGW
jgi:hypothetical protein